MELDWMLRGKQTDLSFTRLGIEEDKIIWMRTAQRLPSILRHVPHILQLAVVLKALTQRDEG